MSALSKPLGLACVLAACAFAELSTAADTFAQRQYYSSWRRHPSRSFAGG